MSNDNAYGPALRALVNSLRDDPEAIASIAERVGTPPTSCGAG